MCSVTRSDLRGRHLGAWSLALAKDTGNSGGKAQTAACGAAPEAAVSFSQSRSPVCPQGESDRGLTGLSRCGPGHGHSHSSCPHLPRNQHKAVLGGGLLKGKATAHLGAPHQGRDGGGGAASLPDTWKAQVLTQLSQERSPFQG